MSTDPRNEENAQAKQESAPAQPPAELKKPSDELSDEDLDGVSGGARAPIE